MSSVSRAVSRLRRQYRSVLTHAREANPRLGSSTRGVSLPHQPCQLEPLEPRLLLDGMTTEQAIQLFSVSPALFVENQGQWADESVRFVHNGSGANVAMTDAGPVFQLSRQVPKDGEADGLGPDDLPQDLLGPDRLGPDAYDTQTLQFSASFVGANSVAPTGLQPSDTRFNYFIGDEANWHAGVDSYETVAYEGLYDGIDLHNWGQRDSLKYEFHVAPGAVWSDIQVRYDGIEGLSINEAGQLAVDLGDDWGQIIDDAPYIYQEIDGERVEVAGQFVLLDEWTYSFEIAGDYDPTKELVIDPDLDWSTYLGGSGGDMGYGIAVDAAGNALVTGDTWSSGWVSGGFDTTHNGVSDAFVAKLSASGGHLWSTYLGGGSYDHGRGIAADAAGNALVTGWTRSSGWVNGGFDTTHDDGSSHGSYDAFVAKLSASGGHLWSTYLGGSGNDWGWGIAADAAGNALVTGETQSSGWVNGGFDATHNGEPDAFVVKLSASGGHLWSTYLGGSSLDYGYGIAADAAGNALVTGMTYSSGRRAFVAKLSASGGHLWSTYLGGSDWDLGLGIAVDAAGSALVTGYTASSGWVSGGFDTTLDGYSDAFVAKIGAYEPLPLEILARGVAYDESWSPGQTLVFDGQDLGYTVERVFSGSSGFYALGLASDTFGPALVIQGTKTLIDWWADSDPRGVGYEQFARNWKTGQNLFGWLSSLAGLPDITGHSLGGAVAQWIAADFTHRGYQIDQLVTFNSPGITNDPANNLNLITDASKFVPTRAYGVTHYMVNGDVVSMAGDAFLPGEVRMARFSDLSMWDFDKHLLPLTVPTIGTRQRPSDLAWDFSVTTGVLSAPGFSYDDLDYNLWVMGLQVALNGLSAAQPWLGPLAAVPAMLMHRGTTEAGRRLIGQALRMVEYAGEWTLVAADRFRLTLQEGVHSLYEAMGLTVHSSFNLSVDGGSPPMLAFDGALGLDLGGPAIINMPSWLGGTFTGDHLIDMVNLDLVGAMDRDRLSVTGELSVLGGLLDATGAAELDWLKGELAVNGTTSIANGFITLDGSLVVRGDLNVLMGGGATVTIPPEVPWFGGIQIADGNFLVNYVPDLDMSNDFLAGWGSIGNLPALGLRVWFDGRWEIMGAREIGELESPGESEPAGAPAMAFNATSAAPYGETYTIEPGTDWTLFFVEWDNASPTAQITLQTPSGPVLTEVEIEADPTMALVGELCDDRRKAVRVDTPAAGDWTVTLVDATGLGTVDITALVVDTAPSVAVVSATGGQRRQPVRIDIEAFDPDSDAVVALFCDTDAAGFDGIMIADGIAEADGPGAYDWDTTGVPEGEYYIYARIMDDSNVPVMAYGGPAVEVTDPLGTVVGRRVFYNHSASDCDREIADPFDDAAIAADKVALLPGTAGTSANITSYSRGINGIMVDIAGLADTVDLTPANIGNYFTFKVGNDNEPSAWHVAPAPSEVLVRHGAGEGGSARVTLIWPDGAIQKQWLQVSVLSDDNGGAAGLTEEGDVFYFGNLPGDVDGNGTVGAADYIALKRAFGSSVMVPGGATDFDASGAVDYGDLVALMGSYAQSIDMAFSAPAQAPAAVPAMATTTAGAPDIVAEPAGAKAVPEPLASLAAEAAAAAATMPGLPVGLSAASSTLRGNVGILDALAHSVMPRLATTPPASPLLSHGRAGEAAADVLTLSRPWWPGDSAGSELPDAPWMTRLTVDITGKLRKGRLDPLGLDVLAASR